MIRNDEGAPTDRGPNAQVTETNSQSTPQTDYVQRWNERALDDPTAFILSGDEPSESTVLPYSRIAEKHMPQLVAISAEVAADAVASQNGALYFRNRRPDGSTFDIRRLDNPPVDPKTGKPECKYVHPKNGRGLNVHPLAARYLADSAAPLIVVEGQKQYLAVVSAALGKRLCPVGMSGIRGWQWKPGGPNTPSVPLPDWGHIPLEGRKVYVVPDGDYATNKDVKAGADRLCAWLTAQGAQPHRVTVPLHEGEKTGADDHLARIEAAGRQAELLRLCEQAEGESDEERAAAERMMADLLDSEELDAIKPPEYLIKGWLTRDSLNRIVGEPNSGKSLVALDWAACVGAGIDWNKHPVKQGTVVYVIAEGVRGFTKRKRAWEIQYGRTMTGVKFYPKPIEVVGRQFGSLAESAEWRTFRRVMQTIRPTLIVLDTQRRVTSEASENDNTEMNKVVKVLEALRAETGACVLLVHHTPKGGAGGAGAGAVLAAVNSEFMMTKKGHGVSATFKLMNEKEKDEADGYGVHMALRVHTTRAPDPFEEDGDGDLETSVVLEQMQQENGEPAREETAFERIVREMDEAGLPTGLGLRGSRRWLIEHGVDIRGGTDMKDSAVKHRDEHPDERPVPPSPPLKGGGTDGTHGVPPVSRKGRDS